jgi:Asp-tRNA(Asn)/Glu-tRNA(Gln) amidotransferase A subunit family amidase
MVTKAELHEAIDRLPASALAAVAQAMARIAAEEAAIPAFLRNVPLVEPEPDEIEALAALDPNEPGISTEELMRELGL